MLIQDGDDAHFNRLVDVVDWNFDRNRPDREIHKLINEAMMGEYYPRENGVSGIETPINLMSLAKRAMSRSLISKSPRMMALTAEPELKSYAEDAEISGNQRIIESNLDRTIASEGLPMKSTIPGMSATSRSHS